AAPSRVPRWGTRSLPKLNRWSWAGPIHLGAHGGKLERNRSPGAATIRNKRKGIVCRLESVDHAPLQSFAGSQQPTLAEILAHVRRGRFPPASDPTHDLAVDRIGLLLQPSAIIARERLIRISSDFLFASVDQGHLEAGGLEGLAGVGVQGPHADAADVARTERNKLRTLRGNPVRGRSRQTVHDPINGLDLRRRGHRVARLSNPSDGPAWTIEDDANPVDCRVAGELLHLSSELFRVGDKRLCVGNAIKHQPPEAEHANAAFLALEYLRAAAAARVPADGGTEDGAEVRRRGGHGAVQPKG